VGFSHFRGFDHITPIEKGKFNAPSLDISQKVYAYFTTITQSTSDPGPIAAIRTVRSE